jgi:MOSC domain-containing protein YiiM
LRPGKVVTGDELVLIKRVQEEFTMARIYWLRYNAEITDVPEVNRALDLDTLASSAKRGLTKRLTFMDRLLNI